MVDNSVALPHDESEILQLKAKVKWMDVLMRQNAALEGEVCRLCGELDEATRGILKRGYLYKYRDRTISFASQWGLRYFVLQGKVISYYADEKDNRPRRTIDLSHCIVRSEGTKKGGTYHVFCVYLASAGLRSAESLLLRLSTESLVEKTQWIDMLEQACALGGGEGDRNPFGATWKDSREDITDMETDAKPNDLHTKRLGSGTVTNITKLTNLHKNEGDGKGDGGGDEGDEGDEEEWGNSPIDGDYGYSNNKHLLGSDLLTPQMLQRVQSSNLILKKSFSRSIMSRTLLSPVPHGHEATAVVSKKPLEKIKSFPAFKPMHTSAKSSPLSSDVGPGEQNYRGFFNLGLIIMFLSHFRLVGDNLMKHGILFSPFLSSPPSPSPFQSPQVLLTAISWISTIFMSYFIERVIIYKTIRSEKTVLFINFLNGAVNLVVPCLWVWVSDSNPLFKMIYLFNSVILFMKIVSYAHANRDLRKVYMKDHLITTGKNTNDKDKNSKNKSRSDSQKDDDAYDSNGKPYSTNIFTEASDLEYPYVQYPENITPQNLIYFVLVPSLTYQLNYPRNKRIRKRYVITILLRMFIVMMLIVLTFKQYIEPVLILSDSNQKLNTSQLLEKILILSIPNTYIWLLGFYFYFHLYLNLFAELTRFGDRVFYKDWWNARTIESYWRNWNIPVHCWMLRHLYYPLTRVGLSKSFSSIVVFTVSAALHELIISIPLGKISFHAFFGMLAQVPLIFITKGIDKRFDNPFLGNIIFWSVFCVVGQPMGVLMYSFDIWKMFFPDVIAV